MYTDRRKVFKNALGAVTMALHNPCTLAFRHRKRRVRNLFTRLSSSSKTKRSVAATKQRQHGGWSKESDNLNSSLTTFHETSMLLMQNAGEKLRCLLNLINQQVQQQNHLWSQLQFPTKEGYRPLHHIRARRLKSLLALAYYLDEKDKSHANLVASNGPSLNTKTSGETIELQAQLLQMSITE